MILNFIDLLGIDYSTLYSGGESKSDTLKKEKLIWSKLDLNAS